MIFNLTLSICDLIDPNDKEGRTFREVNNAKVNNCDHDLQVIDDSFEHQYGCEEILYYQCSICDATSKEDKNIPEQVDWDPIP